MAMTTTGRTTSPQRLRRSLTNIRADIENEIGADDIRQQLHNESIMKELKETRQQLQRVVNQTDETLTEIKQASTALSLADLPPDLPPNSPSNSPSNTEPSRDPTKRPDARG